MCYTVSTTLSNTNLAHSRPICITIFNLVLLHYDLANDIYSLIFSFFNNILTEHTNQDEYGESKSLKSRQRIVGKGL